MISVVTGCLAAWLLTYLIHSTLLFGLVALAERAAGERFEGVAEVAWRTAMFGSVATSLAQVILLVEHPSLVLASAAGVVSQLPSGDTVRTPATMSTAGALPWLVGTWLFVALVRVTTLRWSVSRMARRIHAAIRPMNADVMRFVAGLAGGRIVRVTSSEVTTTPLVLGADELCVPAHALRTLSSDELNAVLAHEVAHILRRDPLWLMGAEIVCRALFFQPLNRVGAGRLRAIAECACDDWAVRRIGDPVAMASALTRVTGWILRVPAPALAIGLVTRESLAVRRVRRILAPVHRTRGAESRRGILAAAVLLAATVSLVPGISATGAIPRPYIIHAMDDAGAFTVTVDRGRVIGVSMQGSELSPERVDQVGNVVRVRDLDDRKLELTLTGNGGIRWSSRRPRPSSN